MKKGDQTKQEIIRKAARVFHQRGYDGAALSDLMKAPGLEKGGTCRGFSSKEALAAEAFDYGGEGLAEHKSAGERHAHRSVGSIAKNFLMERPHGI